MTFLVIVGAVAAGAAVGSLGTHRWHEHRWEAAHYDRWTALAGRVRRRAIRDLNAGTHR